MNIPTALRVAHTAIQAHVASHPGRYVTPAELADAVVAALRDAGYLLVLLEETDLREHAGTCDEYHVIYEDDGCDCETTPLFRRAGDGPRA